VVRILIERLEQEIPESGDVYAVPGRILANVGNEGLRR
jgi:hypothetical protein